MATSDATWIAYATLPDGAVRRLEITAQCQACALWNAFQAIPNAVAMSARAADQQPPAAVFVELERRAQ